MHGWCGSAAVWDEVVPALARRSRVLALSLPGFGGMAPPPPEAATMAGMAGAVAQVLDRVGATGVALVGHSMGGPVAAETAILVPGRVGAVLGLDTLGDRRFYARVPDGEIRRRHADFRADYPGRMRAMVDAIVHPAAGAALRNGITAAMLAAAPPDFALLVRDHLLGWDMDARWPLVRCPAMLLNSPLVIGLAEAEPTPCLAFVPVEVFESGHFAMLEHPGPLAGTVAACLQRLRPP